MATLRVAQINPSSYVDGPGRRAVLYLAGCPIQCPGCQSRHLWPEDNEPGHAGLAMDVDEVAARLLDTGLPVTISGGEPLAQAAAVAELLIELRIQQPEVHIVVYTGFVVEDILDTLTQATPEIWVILQFANVLVDGPFQPEDDHDWVQWRGSRNQRPIDLRATWAQAWRFLALLDWDTPTLTVTTDGDLVGAAGTMAELFEPEAVTPARMCGQTKPV